MDIKAKLRPFYVAKMLYEQTDEDHYLTIEDAVTVGEVMLGRLEETWRGLYATAHLSDPE